MEFTTNKIDWKWLVRNDEKILKTFPFTHPQDEPVACDDLKFSDWQFVELEVTLLGQESSVGIIVLLRATSEEEALAPEQQDKDSAVFWNLLIEKYPEAHIIQVKNDTPDKESLAPNFVACELLRGLDLQAAGAATAIALQNGTPGDQDRFQLTFPDGISRYVVSYDAGTWTARVTNADWK